MSKELDQCGRYLGAAEFRHRGVTAGSQTSQTLMNGNLLRAVTYLAEAVENLEAKAEEQQAEFEIEIAALQTRLENEIEELRHE